MATPAEWIEGARLRTLPLAIAPIIAGSAAAYEIDAFKPWYAFLAFFGGVFSTGRGELRKRLFRRYQRHR